MHAALPGITAPSGAYAMVGMGGAVAALTRGPLTGLMMVYELSGNYAIILPLMVTCTIASALCHALVERRAGVDANTLGRVPVDGLVAWMEPVEPGAWAPEVRERLLASLDKALPVRDAAGTLLGVVCASVLEARELRANRGTVEGWVRRVPAVSVETSVGEALRLMDAHEVDALPVRGEEKVGVVTRAGLLRFLQRERRIRQKEPPFSPTELSR
jgi:CIC family chloride channel protein